MTYLQLVNSVLRRLREDEVVSVENSTDSYIKLIGDYVNDAKRIVEDSWDWTMLRTTDTVSTSSGQYVIQLSNLGNSFKTLFVRNTDTKSDMKQVSYHEMIKKHFNPSSGSPQYFSYDNELVESGKVSMLVYPTPDKEENLQLYVVQKTDGLTTDNATLKVPSAPVIHYAVALAARERGETGGTSAQELFSVADTMLADAIAIDASRVPYETIWTPC